MNNREFVAPTTELFNMFLRQCLACNAVVSITSKRAFPQAVTNKLSAIDRFVSVECKYCSLVAVSRLTALFRHTTWPKILPTLVHFCRFKMDSSC